MRNILFSSKSRSTVFLIDQMNLCYTKVKYKETSKDIRIRCVSVISLITDKRLDTIKPSLLPINDRQVKTQ